MRDWFREAGHPCETHCKPRSGAAVGNVQAITIQVPRSGTYTSTESTAARTNKVLLTHPLIIRRNPQQRG